MKIYEYKLEKIKSKHYKWSLQRYYNKISIKPNLDSDYVYFPLQKQPEKTTCPEGVPFDNQLLAIKMIADVIPEHWDLFIKEHPSQFTKFDGYRGRSKRDYDDIEKVPNAWLVDSSANPYKIIDNSKFVATITGTPGWEAVLRKIPSVVFGNAWYRTCDNVYYIESKSDLQRLVNNSSKLEINHDQHVYNFVSYIENIGFRGYQFPTREAFHQMSSNENIENTSEALIRFINSRQEI